MAQPAAADTPPPAVTSTPTAPALEQVTKGTIEAAIDKARSNGKPILFVAVSPQCAACASLVKSLPEAAAKHPELVIVTADAASFGVAVGKLPLAALVAPQIGRSLVFQKFNLGTSPTELDAFLTEHGGRAVTMTKLDKEFYELSGSLTPLFDRLSELYGRVQDDEKNERIALNEKIAGILLHMADNQHKIAEMMQQERDASDK
jgi:thiol-disulfide isomerase/thioredoxin